RGREAEAGALSGDVRPWGFAQVLQAVAHAMPVEAPGGPREDRVDAVVIDVAQEQRGRRGPPRPRSRALGGDAGRGHRPEPAVEADVDELDRPIEGVRER